MEVAYLIRLIAKIFISRNLLFHMTIEKLCLTVIFEIINRYLFNSLILLMLERGEFNPYENAIIFIKRLFHEQNHFYATLKRKVNLSISFM